MIDNNNINVPFHFIGDSHLLAMIFCLICITCDKNKSYSFNTLSHLL